jgi:hypothetical protein
MWGLEGAKTSENCPLSLVFLPIFGQGLQIFWGGLGRFEAGDRFQIADDSSERKGTGKGIGDDEFATKNYAEETGFRDAVVS